MMRPVSTPLDEKRKQHIQAFKTHRLFSRGADRGTGGSVSFSVAVVEVSAGARLAMAASDLSQQLRMRRGSNRCKLLKLTASSCSLSTIVEENKQVRSEKKNLAIRSNLVRGIHCPFKCEEFRHGRRRTAHRNRDFDTFARFPTLLLDLLRNSSHPNGQWQVSKV
jgi:hypothetical protein